MKSATAHHLASPRAGISRRVFGQGALGAFGLSWLQGCGFPVGGEGVAFAPWDFPGALSRPEDLAIGAAILAPSPHNTQPWALVMEADHIDLYANLERSLGAMDGLHREMYIGLGCALENLVIAARHNGLAGQVQMWPDPTNEAFVARIAIDPAAAQASELYGVIAERHTNRGAYADGEAPPNLQQQLEEQLAGLDLHFTYIDGGDARARFIDGTVEATEAIVADTEMNEMSHSWYRHTAEEVEEHRDGVILDAIGLGSALHALAKGSRPSAETAGKYWIKGTASRQATGAAFCILSTPQRQSRAQQIAVGRAYQRLQLWGTTQGLSMHPLNQMPERQDREQVLGLEPRFTDLLHDLIGDDSLGAQLLFRVGYAWQESARSPRRPAAWVMQ